MGTKKTRRLHCRHCRNEIQYDEMQWRQPDGTPKLERTLCLVTRAGNCLTTRVVGYAGDWEAECLPCTEARCAAPLCEVGDVVDWTELKTAS